jgi:4a-hydroxytetrahydrobiopterin dehydratase
MSELAGARLTDVEIDSRLASLRAWERKGDSITTDFRFKDFSEAFAFMTRVALLAEAAGHHPNWTNVYNRVTIALSTHDAGGVTEQDFALAAAIDALIEG